MYSNFKEQAIEYVRQAVQEDNAGNYAKAFPLYMNALENFKTHLKYEKNPKIKEAITQKFTEYLRRVEEIRAVLDEGGTGPAQNGGDAAVETRPKMKTKPKDGEDGEDPEQSKLRAGLNSAIVREKPNIKWNDVAGLESAKQALQEAVILPVKFPQFFTVRSVTTPTEAFVGFNEMVSGTQRKYYMLGGKGGVGKTSCAASLAVKFANHGHPTLVVSTDPAHSLSDSFDQDLTGGALVPVQGVDSPLYALEINPEKTREEFRATSQLNGGSGVKDFMGSMGLGMLADQLGELKLGELLDTPPPGLDEAIAISKVMQFLESTNYSAFSRIVFDTAPTGHTLRLLSLPDFLDASIGKMMKLKKKISSATSALKSMFNKEEPQRDDATDKLEQLRERMAKVRDLFRDSATTEFIVVTIPTVMAVNESSRLCASLKKETIPVRKLIVNQVLPPSASECKFCMMRRKDQMRALDMISKDPELASLKLIQAPLVDVEIRGIAGLKFMGDMVWK